MNADHPRVRGAEPLGRFVDEAIERIPRVAPDDGYLRAVRDLYSYPARHGSLTESERALVLLATQVLVTQLDHDGIERGIEAARASGATHDEILTTVQLAAVIGLHSISWGVPRLRGVLEERGLWPDPADDAKVGAVIARGYRGGEVAGMLRDIAELDPEYFEHFRDALEIPWKCDALTDRMKQLICVAIDACASHLYEEGFVLHLNQALDAGATPADLLEVLQLCSVTGVRSIEGALVALAATAD